MDEKQEIFNKYMDEFLKLDTNQKNCELIEKLKDMLNMLYEYAAQRGVQYVFLKSREVNDILYDTATQDDYLEAMMAYIHNIEELIGLILLNS